jgi:hypothetical protein
MSLGRQISLLRTSGLGANYSVGRGRASGIVVVRRGDS